MVTIQVQNLSKSFFRSKQVSGFTQNLRAFFRNQRIAVPAVRDISFQIEQGEFVGFIGPNGAGKTTTLKMLAGILYPTTGEARVLGYTPWQRKNDYKSQIAMVMGQKSQLWWDLPAMETFLLNRDIYEISHPVFEKNLNELSELLDVTSHLNTPVRKLSLGQRMKCELIAALLHEPKVVFLDEPTIGLDVSSQKAMRDFLKQYNRRNEATIILTSHYMEDVKELCPRIIMINDGQKVYDGSTKALIGKYALTKQIDITFERDVPEQEFFAWGKVLVSEGSRIVLQVEYPAVKTTVEKLFQQYPVVDIAIREEDLSDIIADMFRSKNSI